MADGTFDNLTVSGTSDLGGDTWVGGNLSVGDPGAGLIRTLSVTGAISGGSNLSIAGTISGANTLSITGAISGGSLSITGAISGGNTLNITGAISSGGTLNVSGAISGGGDLTVAGTSDLQGATHIHSTLQVDGASSFVGNVGIGTTNPSRPLHVEGHEIHSGGSIAGFSFGNRQTAAFVAGPSSGERWVWYATGGIARLWSGSDKLSVTSGGNVGIGTTAPGAKLTIDDPTSDTTWNTAAFHKAALGPYWSHIHWGSTGDWYIRSAASTGKVILQDTGGRVGIGIAQPVRQLHVHSDNWNQGAEIHASGATAGLSFTDRETGRTWDNGGAGERWVWYSASRTARLWTPGKNVLEIDPSGNINTYGGRGLGVSWRRWQDMPSWSGGGIICWDLFYGGGTYKHSTIREKEDIQPLTDVLARIDRLNPVSFKRRDKPCGSADIGFIAEEMREVFPECTAEQDSGDESFFAWGINESALHGVAIAGIQELSRKFQTLKRGLSVSRCGHMAVGSSQPLPDQQLYVVGNVRLDCATSDTAAAGEAALPERPIGFIIVNIHGEDYKIPYYGA